VRKSLSEKLSQEEHLSLFFTVDNLISTPRYSFFRISAWEGGGVPRVAAKGLGEKSPSMAVWKGIFIIIIMPSQRLEKEQAARW